MKLHNNDNGALLELTKLETYKIATAKTPDGFLYRDVTFYEDERGLLYFDFGVVEGFVRPLRRRKENFDFKGYLDRLSNGLVYDA